MSKQVELVQSMFQGELVDGPRWEECVGVPVPRENKDDSARSNTSAR